MAHAIVVSAFHMLACHELYRQPGANYFGANYFDDQQRDHLVNRLTRRIQRLEYRVHLEPASVV